MSKPFPQPIKLRKLLGPSFIILALGLGSGEVILWPYISSNFGLGIAWAALLGITFQFFINMEIERYALIKGESIFVGFNRLFRWAAPWFVISTFLGFGLPGIIAASAHVFAELFGLGEFRWLAAGLLVALGIILSVGKTVYGTMERITKLIILLGIPFIIVIAALITSLTDWQTLGAGLIGRGDGYTWFPEGLALASFLAAFAYSGAGGNLNLTQSVYIKEKGYGMGAYAQKISGLFRSREDTTVKLEGESFELTEENIQNFKGWWKKINLEHGLVFWLLGFVGIAVLMVLAYVSTFGNPSNAEGISFVINEGRAIGQLINPFVGKLFLLVVGIMLLQTQLGVLDSTSRIMAENVALKQQQSTVNLSKIYFIFVWAQIAFGVLLFALNIAEPKSLIVLGAVINAVAMFVHVGMTAWLNKKTLPKQLQPKLYRKAIILLIFVFLGFFCSYTLFDTISNLF